MSARRVAATSSSSARRTSSTIAFNSAALRAGRGRAPRGFRAVVAASKPAQPPKRDKQLAREVEHAGPRHAAAQQHREQFGVGQRAWAQRQQALARAFGHRRPWRFAIRRSLRAIGTHDRRLERR